jgi:hypothetical protein
MKKDRTAADSSSDPRELRKWPRKPTLLRAVIADGDGGNPCDCSILDISAGGAQIADSHFLPVGAQVYLLDTGNRIAYLAKVVWSNPTRSGLSFVRKQAIGIGLPPNLTFLWRLLLEAKLREVDRNIARGVPKAMAFIEAGLTEVQLHQMAKRSNGDRKFDGALVQARSLLVD